MPQKVIWEGAGETPGLSESLSPCHQALVALLELPPSLLDCGERGRLCGARVTGLHTHPRQKEQVRQRARGGQALGAVGGMELGWEGAAWLGLPGSPLLGKACEQLLETCLPLSQAWRKSKGSRCPYSTGGEGCGGLPGSTPWLASSADQGKGRGGQRPPLISLHLEVNSVSSWGYPSSDWKRVWPWDTTEGRGRETRKSLWGEATGRSRDVTRPAQEGLL